MSDLSPYVEHLYRIPRERMGECAALAVRAFLGNPINDYLFDGLPNQGTTMRRFYETSLAAAFDASEFYAPDEGLGAMIVVTPPGTGRVGVLDFLRCGGLRIPLTIRRNLLLRADRYEQSAMEDRMGFSDDSTWYLMMLVVELERQGRGVGSSLVRPLLSYLDDHGKTCYLETHAKKNVGLYEHFGFELVKTTTIPKSETTQYDMMYR